MNNIFNNMAFNNLPLCNPGLDLLRMPTTYQGMTSYVSGLQNVIARQQALINNLMAKTQLQERNLEAALIMKNDTALPVKMETNLTPISHQGSNSHDAASEITEDSVHETREVSTKAPKIIRRNGFKKKPTRKIPVKVEDNDAESLSENGSPSKSGDKFKNSSKAKHLWVNYGRRILEYAINQTTGPMQGKIKQLVGKLNSKKDFEKAFQIVSTDNSDEKLFKTLLGRLAIYFVKHKASPTFESSKYKQEMITQRHTVAAWIERLISAWVLHVFFLNSLYH